MINEDFVSFEVAKLLKEKGFYQDFLSEMMPVWKLNGNRTELVFHGCDNYPCENDEWYSAPTLQIAVKWLRLEHQIFIRPDTDFMNPMSYFAEIFCYGNNLKTQQDVMTGKYESPEEALEAAIKHCLENFDI